MKATSSIGFRLAASFIALFTIIIGFGLLGLTRIDAFNEESSAIRERWLKSTRYLGDLSNYTSDFRAMEATFLVAPTSGDAADLAHEAEMLDSRISQAQKNYGSIIHEDSEEKIYDSFCKVWTKYRAEAGHGIEMASKGQTGEAILVYFTSSKRRFSEASDLLEKLNNQNNLRAQQASERSALAIKGAWNYISAALIICIFATITILVYITNTIIYPIKQMSHCMHLLAQGEMDAAIPSSDRQNELGEMASAVTVFRNNAIELKLSQKGLALQASMLEEKLAHEQRLNQQQRNFISMASHEFRTPMTIIDGHAQRLLNAPEPPPSAKITERAKKIRQAIKRMNAIIDNVLRHAKFFDGEPRLYMHDCDFDIRVILHEVCKLHQEISANSTIVEDLGITPLKIEGDRDLLFQVFNNIIANSIKYSPGGGVVTVSCRLVDETVEISIRDNGVGIPGSDIPHIFDRYYRGGNVAGIVGTGIGLFVVKVVVDLHGGAIQVESDGKNGATFTLALPRKQPNSTTQPLIA